MAFPKRETIIGVALTDLAPAQTPVGKPCLLQGRGKTIEVFQFSPGVFYDNFMMMAGIKDWRDENPKATPCKLYNVSETISDSPKDDLYFAELRIWWNNGKEPEQELSMFELVSAFIKREQEWWRKLGNGDPGSIMREIYGHEYIYTGLFHHFALRRESSIREGTVYDEYTIWSYPELTQD